MAVMTFPELSSLLQEFFPLFQLNAVLLQYDSHICPTEEGLTVTWKHLALSCKKKCAFEANY